MKIKALKCLLAIPFFIVGVTQEAIALTGGPDAGGYSFIDSHEVGGPSYNYVDISLVGSVISLYDDSSRMVPIGFTFNYYGVNYTSVNVGSNGFLTFNTGNYGRYSELNLPTPWMPSTVVAPFWDDLYPRYGQVHYQTQGTAPNRTFIVQYRPPFYFFSGTNNFEVILHEGSNDILFQYAYAGTVRNQGSSASIGIQRDSSTGLQYSFRQQRVSAGLAVLFRGGPINSAPTASGGAAQTAQCTGGSSANVMLDGTASSDPDGDTLTYSWTWDSDRNGIFDTTVTGVNPSASFPIGTIDIYLTVDDGNGHTASSTTSVTVQDTTAPTVSAGADQTIEATSTSGVYFDVSTQATASDTCCVVTLNSALGTYALGAHTLAVSGSDCSGNSASDSMV
ncbi:hypothetical protein D8Y20_10265, partial [Mariprofundus sp. EBB-1]|uniref:PKD domain-containing protein n=1 Tax=Mariprofundus sp. EBB-1 TaxID=2650971 RepID=UPI000F101CB7